MSSAYARRRSWTHRPVITEEAVTEAAHTFMSTVQRLNASIREEPVQQTPREKVFARLAEIRAGPHTVRTVH